MPSPSLWQTFFSFQISRASKIDRTMSTEMENSCPKSWNRVTNKRFQSAQVSMDLLHRLIIFIKWRHTIVKIKLCFRSRLYFLDTDIHLRSNRAYTISQNSRVRDENIYSVSEALEYGDCVHWNIVYVIIIVDILLKILFHFVNRKISIGTYI